MKPAVMMLIKKKKKKKKITVLLILYFLSNKCSLGEAYFIIIKNYQCHTSEHSVANHSLTNKTPQLFDLLACIGFKP